MSEIPTQRSRSDVAADIERVRTEQIRNRLGEIGNDVAGLVRDAYARGLRDGLARAREQRERDGFDEIPSLGTPDVDDVAQRRPTVV